MGSLVTVTEPADLPTPTVAAQTDDHAFATRMIADALSRSEEGLG